MPSGDETNRVNPIASARALTVTSGNEEILAILDAMAAAGMDAKSGRDTLRMIKRRTGARFDMAQLDALLRSARQRFQDGKPRPWHNELATFENGERRLTMSNAAIVLGTDTEWTDVLWFNEFTNRMWLRRRPPYEEGAGEPCDRAWTDVDENATTVWVQRAGLHAPNNIVYQGVQLVSHKNRFHPPREYFDSLKWDGVARLDTWPMVYLGAADTPLNRAFGARWMISAVARVYRPGAKVDTCLILEGKQGHGKSTVFKVLAGGSEWFCDEIADFGSKDAALQMVGKLIIELAELDALGRGEVSRIKAFMSRTVDNFRPPYGRQTIKQPRQCVFGGTVNEDEYLRDPTGGRRWWPIACGILIKLDELAKDRDQLWAEAVHRAKGGERWWLDTHLDAELIAAAERAQAARYQADAWETVIGDWLKSFNRPSITIPEVLAEALSITDKAKWTRSDQIRVGNCLKRLGWPKRRSGPRGAEAWHYFRPGAGAAE
jgi:putative DNA primase/helicase